jgi:hypothetical protein
MSNFDLNLNSIEVLNTSKAILSASAPAAILHSAKDMLQGNQPIPTNIGEAVQFFTDSIFGEAADPFYYRSQYGSPVYNYLLIKGEEPHSPQVTESGFVSKATQLSSHRTKYTNNGQPNPNTFDVLNQDLTVSKSSFPAIFMDSAIMTVSKKKKIVKTEVVNRSSTRKEYITSGDYNIKISGVFSTNHHSIYPAADIEALIRALSAPIPLEVVSPHLFRFGITKLVVESFSFPNERGSYAQQKFSIQCCSHASSAAEIGMELLNNTQQKGIIQQGFDEIANLRSTVDDQVQEFLKNKTF